MVYIQFCLNLYNLDFSIGYSHFIIEKDTNKGAFRPVVSHRKILVSEQLNSTNKVILFF